MEEEDMRKASITKDKKSNTPLYFVKGNITEGIGDVLSDSLEKESGEVEVDFSGVTITNSLGIKEWIQTMAELESKITIKMIKCPPAIVHTINMIPKFIGKGSVGSVIGTFYCMNCEATKNHEITINKDISAEDLELKAQFDCEACGHNEMQLEVSSEEYFEFLEAI